MSTDRSAFLRTACTTFVVGWIIASILTDRDKRHRIDALESRMALIETNATETLRATKQSQADLGKLASAVLLWRMWLATNQTARTDP